MTENPAAFWLSNVAGLAAIMGTLMGFLPAFAAGIAITFYMIQIWESSTVRHYLANRRMIRKARKIRKLKARAQVIEAQLDALETLRQAKVVAKEKVAIAHAEAAKQVALENLNIEQEAGD